jgi:hypothetical protein
MPRILLQRAEETFPAVRESMVSVLCLCVQKIMLLSSVNSHTLRNYTLYGKLVLVFIIHLRSLLYMILHIVTCISTARQHHCKHLPVVLHDNNGENTVVNVTVCC